MFYCPTNTALTRLFPNFGFQIITEPSSLEDLPCHGTDKLSNSEASISIPFENARKIRECARGENHFAFLLFFRRNLQQRIQIQSAGEHRQFAIRRARPFFFWPVPIKFHTVFVRIAKIKCLAHAMIRRSVQFDARCNEAAQRIRQRGASRIQNRQMIKSRAARQRRRTACAFPSVQSDVMMITTRRNERRARTKSLLQFKTQHAAIKCQRAIQVRHLSNAHDRCELANQSVVGSGFLSQWQR